MQISNLKKTLGVFTLDIERMSIEKPGVYGLIGPNGSGKSTLAKLIAGLIAPDAGIIDTGGMRGRDITMLTQKPYIMNDSVYNNLVYPLKIRGIKPDAALCGDTLRRIGLFERRKQNARTLSGGEQQKLALCRAMIFRPKMIIADESFTDLDIDSLDMFKGIILDMQERSPLVWLLISHQLPYIRQLCGHLFFMNNGQLEASGPVGEILNMENPAVRRYLKGEAVYL